MENLISALWELRTVFTFLIGVAAGLVIAALLLAARKNSEPDDGPPTILIPPVADDEPLGDMVDVPKFMRRYS